MRPPRPLLLAILLLPCAAPAQSSPPAQHGPAELWRGYVADPDAETLARLLKGGEEMVRHLIESGLGSGNRRERALALRVLPKFGEAAIGPLEKLWKSEDRAQRKLAEILLERIGRPALPVFVRALRRLDSREKALSALRRFGHEAITMLEKELESDQVHLRAAAIRALARIGGEKLPKRLLRFLAEGELLERCAAAEAIGHMRLEEGMGALEAVLLNEKDLSLRRAAAEALAAFGQPATRTFEKLIDSEDVRGCLVAAKSFHLLGGEGRRLLTKGLKSPNPKIRAFMCQAVCELGEAGREFEKLLLVRLDDGQNLVEHSAAMALGALGEVEESTKRRMLRKLQESPPEQIVFERSVMGSVALALGKLRNRGISGPLVEALVKSQPNPFEDTESSLAQAIRARGPAAADAVVAALAGRRSRNERIALVMTLDRMGPKAYATLVQHLSHEDDKVRLQAFDASRRVGAALHETLAKACVDAGPGVRQHLLRTAAALEADAEPWVPLLPVLVKDPDEVARAYLAKILVWRGFPTEASRKAFVVLLEDPVPAVRREAAWAIAARHAEFADLLKAAAQGQDVEMRYTAIRGLSRAQEVGEASLLEFARDESERVRVACATALGKLESPSEAGRATLEGLLGDPKNRVRSAARRALVEWGEDAVPVFLRALASEDWRMRYQAAEAFARHEELRVPEVLAAVKARVEGEKSGLVRRVLQTVLER